MRIYVSILIIRKSSVLRFILNVKVAFQLEVTSGYFIEYFINLVSFKNSKCLLEAQRFGLLLNARVDITGIGIYQWSFVLSPVILLMHTNWCDLPLILFL
jgi:hypothetical protein